jgi:REP element-mobilizing transposase RayT
MGNPIVIAHHLMWTMYGWWLPNDPRGSTSTSVYTSRIAQLAPHHYGREQIQPASRDIHLFYAQARRQLQFPLLSCSPDDRAAIASALSDTIELQKYTCYACVIMPDHVHILIRKHKQTAEEMIDHFQSTSRLRLSSRGLRTPDHPTWTKGGWKVFLDHPTDVRRTIRYIEENPIVWRSPVQHYDFVSGYDDWPLHLGHSANSPYAKALRAARRYTRSRPRS